MLILLLSVAAFALAALGTARLCRPGSALTALDVPNARSLHQRPVPRGGGLAILGALAFSWTAAWILGALPQLAGATVLAGILGVGAVSFVEDRFKVAAGVRLFSHLGAGAFFCATGLAIHELTLPGAGTAALGWAALPFTVLFTAWMVNLFNFMDGMDGLAGGMGFFGFSALAWMGAAGGSPLLAVPSLLLACACLGFLLFNLPPARIFLGDSGSTTLGAAAAGLSLVGVAEGVFPLWIPVLIFSPFIVDATSTLVARLLRGDAVWRPHRKHCYQRLVLAGWSHRRVLAAEQVLMAAAAGSALLAWHRAGAVQAAILAVWAGAWILLVAGVRAVEQRAASRDAVLDGAEPGPRGFFTRLVERFSRRCRRLLLVAQDVLAMTASLAAAFALSGDNGPGGAGLGRYAWVLPLLIGMRLPCLAWCGLYHGLAPQNGRAPRFTVAFAVLLPSLALGITVLAAAPDSFPRAVVPLEAGITLFFLTFSRGILIELLEGVLGRASEREPVVVYGAGEAGARLVHLLRLGKRHHPVAFLDDSSAKQGMLVEGLPVHAPGDLELLKARKGVRHVVLAMPRISASRLSTIHAGLEKHGVPVMRIPAFQDLVLGRAGLDDLREVRAGALLPRASVPPNPFLLRKDIQDKVVLVTGAGGSIGSEICRQVLAQGPRLLVLYESNEYALYQIQQELLQTGGEQRFACVLGSVLDENRLQKVMDRVGAQSVYHAAAFKHVPMVEQNPLEGIRNNVLGTWTCARAALAAGVSHFVLVSTDKAVRPHSVMGATKRAAELACQAVSACAGAGRRTRFLTVRFGNVLGSTGSVVPLFRRQILAGGPVTVTHPDVERYFMTIEEASQLVIQAGALEGEDGVFILDMGKPVRVLDLARRMIALCQPPGSRPVEIQFTGLRKGEKLKEELLDDLHEARPTLHPRIFRARMSPVDPDRVLAFLGRLDDACRSDAVEHALLLLQELVPEYVPSEGLRLAGRKPWSLAGYWEPPAEHSEPAVTAADRGPWRQPA